MFSNGALSKIKFTCTAVTFRKLDWWDQQVSDNRAVIVEYSRSSCTIIEKEEQQIREIKEIINMEEGRLRTARKTMFVFKMVRTWNNLNALQQKNG